VEVPRVRRLTTTSCPSTRTRNPGLTTPLLRSDVGQRLVEHPLMTEGVIHRGLPLAVLPVVQRIDQGGAVSLGHLDDGRSITDFQHHLMRPAFGGETPAGPHLGDDELGHRFAQQSQLRPMALPDADVLHETEDLAVPGDRRADVSDGQHRRDQGVRCRTIRQHPTRIDRQVTLARAAKGWKEGGREGRKEGRKESGQLVDDGSPPTQALHETTGRRSLTGRAS
jgi:hypothetical protein